MTTRQQPTASEHAAALISAYVLAEAQLLAGFTRILRAAEISQEGALTALPKLRRLVARIVQRLARGDRVAEAMVSAAIDRGTGIARQQTKTLRAVIRAAGVDARGGSRGPGGGRPPGRGVALPEDDEPFNLSLPHADRAAQTIRDDIVSELQDVRRRITRLPDDIYKMIAPHGAIYQVLDNDVTPAQAQAMAWRVFVSQGITGFTDKSGRDWSLSAYVEMAVRTASMRAQNTSHLERMLAIGVEYFTVPPSAHPCPLCFPWQGRVITAVPIANPDPRITVAGTLEQAIAAGLFHPNCAHVLIPVYPGITVLEPGVWTDELQREYTLSQRQRAIERDIRKAKRQLEHALTPEARAEAKSRLDRQFARMRAFINETGFARDRRREQTDLTDPRIKLPEPIRV